MVADLIYPVFDAGAALGFLFAGGVGYLNYRDAELEDTFWLSFTFAAGAGFLWTGFVTVEWLGVSGDLMDALGTSLQAVVIGVFAVGSTGTLAIIEDLKASRSESERSRRESERRRREAEDTRAEADESRRRAEEMNAELTEKAHHFSGVMTAAAAGDLTRRMDPESQNEAMTEIADSFNAMMAQLAETVLRIQSFGGDVASLSEEVSAGSEETRLSSEQVSESVQEISIDTDRQNSNLQEAVTEMQNLSGAVEEVASSAEEMAQSAAESVKLGREGSESATDALEEMDAIEARADETVVEVRSLADEIAQIVRVVEMISDIADQTNLLALNASIEAARAGSAGKGFGVVASEIKQLAGGARNATEEIETLIEDIQASADDTVRDMTEMGERVSAGSATIEEALAALDAIAKNVEEVDMNIQEVRNATDDQAASTEEVASMIEDVAAVSDQISSESDNISAAAEEQTSSLTQVSETTRSLSRKADELRELLGEFVVEEGARRAASTGERPIATDD